MIKNISNGAWLHGWTRVYIYKPWVGRQENYTRDVKKALLIFFYSHLNKSKYPHCYCSVDNTDLIAKNSHIPQPFT